MPGDRPELLGMPDIELLGILKILCVVIKGQNMDRKSDSQRVEPSSTLSCKANMDIDGRSDNADIIISISNMPDYFRSSTSREADSKSGQLITQRIHSEFSDFFRNWVLQGHI